MSKVESNDLLKLKIYYKDSKVTRKYYFASYFTLFRFIYNILHKDRVLRIEVEKIYV